MPAAVGTSTDRVRLVLADDHLVVRAGLRSLLSTDSGFDVVAEAHDVPSTRRAVQALRPDVLVLDLTMGDDSSLRAIPELLQAAPSMRVLVLTMHEDPAFAEEALRLGAHGYLLKEAAAAELLRAVHTVARGGTYLQPALGAAVVRRQASADRLSGRERAVLSLIAAGFTNAEIAERLYVSLRTVEAHRSSLRTKLGLDTRAELSAYARAHGLLSP